MGITEAAKRRATIDHLRGQLAYGQITYEEAEAIAAPLIEAANNEGKAIAKKYGVKYKPVNFRSLIR